MILHSSMGNTAAERKSKLKELIGIGAIALGGNRKLKIYGSLHCRTGKRMLVGNRVFFSSEEEAIAKGYRPCGHCMHEAYLYWRKKNKS